MVVESGTGRCDWSWLIMMEESPDSRTQGAFSMPLADEGHYYLGSSEVRATVTSLLLR